MRSELSINDENAFRELCRKHGLKVTPQRLAIYRILMDSGDHPNADVVFRKIRPLFPKISFETVNRTLRLFSEAGMIRIVEGYGHPRRFDSNLSQHHHFHCIKCHRIIDFTEQTFNDLQVPENITRRFQVTDKKVVLEGICDQCR